MDNVQQEVRKFVLENYCFNQEGALGNEDSFMERGIIDSTGLLELVSFVEERFAIKIDTYELTPDNFDTISRVTEFVLRNVSVA